MSTKARINLPLHTALIVMDMFFIFVSPLATIILVRILFNNI